MAERLLDHARDKGAVVDDSRPRDDRRGLGRADCRNKHYDARREFVLLSDVLDVSVLVESTEPPASTASPRSTPDALAQPGVLKVLSHLDVPRLPYRPTQDRHPRPAHGCTCYDQVHFHGQPIVVVVATTLETARHTVRLVRVEYAAEQPSTDLSTTASAEAPVTYERSDAHGALQAADVRLELTYPTARNCHRMTPHATVARSDGTGSRANVNMGGIATRARLSWACRGDLRCRPGRRSTRPGRPVPAVCL
ncbi:hypothetical protein GCM10010306_062760 [Streptomyces umbrinus]|uniref:xanthine dehydrogenase family protein molybdopterin-binding subunit n=1 Tax=Streptomyces umbrinus TaxID=67370 RepID=UPI001674D96D|nr:xanthine dehydrogenase family protein molybdopterin-binding subunit [Streptomyces umbrinus]GHB60614.1 hypothetical protein GCM10010306_062760 [Streptomyces umbrinus]